VFTPISAIFGLLFFASTLPNGIRLIELPSQPDSIEIVAGYTSAGMADFTSTRAAQALLYDAYAVGAHIDLVEEFDRTALRITAPKWSLPVLSSRVSALFQDIPKQNDGEAAASPLDFREKVEEEIRGALLGAGEANAGYSTENAFVLMSEPPPSSLREALAAIPRRGSVRRPQDVINRLPAERTLRFKSDLPVGAVILASPLPTVFYKQWYSMLLLDRLIRRVVPLPLKTALPLAARPYYYRLELPVPAGQFPEPFEESLLQELQRLQFVQAAARDFSAARDEAAAYLDSKPVREWFASHDILNRREEGMQWIQSMTADDMRVAARDLLIMNRVIATWAPKPRLTSVSSEPLAPAAGAAGEQRAASIDDRSGRSQSFQAVGEQSQLSATRFPQHADATATVPPSPAERLASGVSLVAAASNAVFVSGGPMTRFDRDLTADDLKAFQQYRAERILVLAPAGSIDRARQLWSAFRGNPNGETGVPRGKTSSGDLSALAVLKNILDLKIIESGWWRDVSVRIDAGQGTDLQIVAPADKRQQILAWIKTVAEAPPADSFFEWVREVSMHQFANIRADLQALTWEHDPQGTVQDLQTVSAKHVQDVARIYF
jgi:hypothetical protein